MKPKAIRIAILEHDCTIRDIIEIPSLLNSKLFPSWVEKEIRKGIDEGKKIMIYPTEI